MQRIIFRAIVAIAMGFVAGSTIASAISGLTAKLNVAMGGIR